MNIPNFIVLNFRIFLFIINRFISISFTYIKHEAEQERFFIILIHLVNRDFDIFLKINLRWLDLGSLQINTLQINSLNNRLIVISLIKVIKNNNLRKPLKNRQSRRPVYYGYINNNKRHNNRMLLLSR